MVGKAQKSQGARSELNSVFGLKKLISGTPLEHPPYSYISPHAISGLLQSWKGRSEARNFGVINGFQHVFKKWVERCKKCIAFQGKYFEKTDRHCTFTKFRIGVIRWVHELCKRPSCVCSCWKKENDTPLGFITRLKLLISYDIFLPLCTHICTLFSQVRFFELPISWAVKQ
jgi:hypothetical protein